MDDKIKRGCVLTESRSGHPHESSQIQCQHRICIHTKLQNLTEYVAATAQRIDEGELSLTHFTQIVLPNTASIEQYPSNP